MSYFSCDLNSRCRASRCLKPVPVILSSLLIITAVKVQAQGIEINYGLDITSNYISKGFTQTEDKPAIHPYVEFAYGQAYVEFWGSNTSFGGISDIEFDAAVGVSPQLGPIGIDLGFVQYFYRDDKTDYGEAYLFANYAFSEDSFVEFRYYREVYSDFNTFYFQCGVSDLSSWDLSLSGGVGSDFGSRNQSEDAIYTDFGLTKGLGDNAANDLRAYYSTIEGCRIVMTLSFFNWAVRRVGGNMYYLTQEVISCIGEDKKMSEILEILQTKNSLLRKKFGNLSIVRMPHEKHDYYVI